MAGMQKTDGVSYFCDAFVFEPWIVEKLAGMVHSDREEFAPEAAFCI